MRCLILSDIHSNWEALEAVLACADGKFDRILCCGDLVGYGADPNRVTAWASENLARIVRGNHDKACVGMEDLDWFNPVARAAAVWTQQALEPANREYLRSLMQGPDGIDGFQILHGSPLDEDEYLITENDAGQVAPYLETDVSFFGHTHIQGGFLCHRNGVKRLTGPPDGSAETTLELERDVSYLINPGSVGQPRDNDPRAGYAIYEPDARLVTFYRAEYDIAAAQKKIFDAGLPDTLALRLSLGV